MRKWIPIILILASIAAFFVVIDPQYDEVKVLKIKKERNNDFLKKAEILEQRKSELRRSYDAIPESDRKQLEKLLPDTVDNVRLILDINSIAETYGVVIKDISVSSEETKSSENTSEFSGQPGFVDESSIAANSLVGTIDLNFSVSATYEVFNEFMKDLEDKLRIVDIRSIDISRDSSSSVYDYKVGLETYWLR